MDRESTRTSLVDLLMDWIFQNVLLLLHLVEHVCVVVAGLREQVQILLVDDGARLLRVRGAISVLLGLFLGFLERRGERLALVEQLL